jgi:hypothetical protein
MIPSSLRESVAVQHQSVQALHDVVENLWLVNFRQFAQKLMNELQSLRQLVNAELEFSHRSVPKIAVRTFLRAQVEPRQRRTT